MDFGLSGVQHSEISKKDWMNISEHERRARDSRRTARRGSNTAGLAGTAMGLTVAHHAMYGQGKPEPFTQARHLASGLNNARKFNGVRAAARVAPLAARNAPHGAAILAETGIAAGGLAVAGGARINEKRHDIAISRQRKARVKKSLDEVAKFSIPGRLGNPATATIKGSVIKPPTKPLAIAATPFKGVAGMGKLTKVGAGVGAAAAGGLGLAAHQHNKNKLVKPTVPGISKAYDPERNRMRRMDHYSTAAAVGSGAAVTGAVVQGRKAYKPMRGVLATKRGRAALGHSGGTAALGLTAVGLAVGADRIRSYKNGRGGSYRPLRHQDF